MASRVSHTTINCTDAFELSDRRNPDGTGWMVLSDPAGNLFCIVRSDEERDLDTFSAA